MSDPTTINLGLAVPTRGSDVGTWDVPLNGDMNIIDSKFGVVVPLGLSNVPVTLNAAQYQSAVLRFSGALTANVTVTLPAVSLGYACENLCTGPWALVLTCGAGQNISIPPGECVDVYTDGTNVKFKNLGRVGSYLDYAGASVPGWIATCSVPPFLLCDGSTYSSGTYPALFAILGTTTLPDLRGRSRANVNGGTGRITTANGGIDGNTIFASGGSDAITLNTTQIPSHQHNGTTGDQDRDHTHDVFGAFVDTGSVTVGGGTGRPSYNNQTLTTAGVSQGHAHPFTTSNTGGGLSHINMQPTFISGITMIRAA